MNDGESWWNNWNMSMVTMVSNRNDGEKLTILAIFMEILKENHDCRKPNETI